MAHASDGYSTNLPLEEALKPDVLLVHTVDGEPLARAARRPGARGRPAALGVEGREVGEPRLELLTHDRRGYWEIRGYSNTAHPWRDDRMW